MARIGFSPKGMRLAGLFAFFAMIAFFPSVSTAMDRSVVRVDTGNGNLFAAEIFLVEGFPVYRIEVPEEIHRQVDGWRSSTYLVLEGTNRWGLNWKLVSKVSPREGGDRRLWTEWTYCPSCFGFVGRATRSRSELAEMGARILSARRAASGADGEFSGGSLRFESSDPGLVVGRRVPGMAIKAAAIVSAFEPFPALVGKDGVPIGMESRRSLVEILIGKCGGYSPKGLGGTVQGAVKRERQAFLLWQDCMEKGVTGFDRDARRRDYLSYADRLRGMGIDPVGLAEDVETEVAEVRRVWEAAKGRHEDFERGLLELGRREGQLAMEVGPANEVVVGSGEFRLKGDISEGLGDE